MKRYALYGEVNFSPISMKSNSLADLLGTVGHLKKTCISVWWYSVYKVHKHVSEELLQSEVIVPDYK